jgi:hypothetical protein
MTARWMRAACLVALVTVGPGLGAATPGETRQSGKVVEVRGRTIVFEELVAWRGPGTGIVRREVQITPRTSVQLVERAPDRTTVPGYTETPIDASELRPGDFVTVVRRQGEPHADALEVVRPESER